MAIAVAQFAPADDDADTVIKGERERPDRAVRDRALFVGIGDLDDVFGADRLADRGELAVAHRDRIAGADQQAGGFYIGPEIVGQHRVDLGEHVARRLAERLVGAFRYPARAEHERLDLFLRKHQRREHEAGAQHIADARLAIDRRALRAQRLDVAIQRAQRYAEFLGKHRTRDGTTMPPQHLDQIEQALGAGHRHAVAYADEAWQ